MPSLTPAEVPEYAAQSPAGAAAAAAALRKCYVAAPCRGLWASILILVGCRILKSKLLAPNYVHPPACALAKYAADN